MALLWKRSAIYHRPRAAKQLAGNLPEIFKTEVSPYPSWILVVYTISIGSKHALVLALCCKLVSYVLLQIVHPVVLPARGDAFGPNLLPALEDVLLYRGPSGPDFCGSSVPLAAWHSLVISATHMPV